MSELDNGGPAFPAHPEHYDNDSTGMTLRDYFAIHADLSKMEFNSMSALVEFVGEEEPDSIDDAYVMGLGARVNAKLRYLLADAMLAERKK